METIGLKKQFDLIRSRVITFIESCPEEILNVKPIGHNNSILWIVGHVLISAESFINTFDQNKNIYPIHYYELFGRGSSLDQWTGVIPSIDELKKHLILQQEQILAQPIYVDDTPLKAPFLTFETAGELIHMICFHETLHLGQMQAMKRSLTA
ncbi:MAG: formate dehydrogenase [Bacillales bacterium]|nr:formate dehydrogenase [Bacillales bacterium]